MKKFILKLTALFALLGLTYVLVFAVTLSLGPQYSHTYNAAFIDKAERLKSIDEPKIILVGNSNLAFGMNSEIVEQKTGYKVVNMGLHGDLGNRIQENMAKLNLNKGDIVIACYTSFSDDELQSTISAYSTVENHYDLYKIFSARDIVPMIQGFPEYAEKIVRRRISGEGQIENPAVNYSRNAFNVFGDVATERKHSIEFKENMLFIPKIDDKSIDRMNKFGKYCESCGATYLVAGYPIAYGEFSPSEEEYRAFQKQLEEKLDYDVISDYTDYFFDYSLFFDTKYHLIPQGADMRAEQLADDILNWLEKNK